VLQPGPRVAIITTVHSPLDIRIFWKQAISLSDAGYRVSLLSRRGLGDSRISVTQAFSRHGIHDFSLYGGSGRLTRPRLWWKVVSILSRTHFDVWHFHDPELLPLLIILRWIRRRRHQTALVYDVHEDYGLEVHEKEWIPLVLRPTVSHFADLVERWGARRCDCVIVATDAIGDKLRKHASRCRVVRNYPVERRRSIEQRVETPIRAVFVGGLAVNRGIPELVSAMHLVKTTNLELHFYGTFASSWKIDGLPDTPTPLECRLRASAPANVFFHGHVSPDTVGQILDKAHIGVVTLLPTRNHLEALPNKLFEYMQASLPIIASNFPIWEPYVTKTGCGIQVDPTNPKAIAGALDILANDSDLRRSMGQRGAAHCQKYYLWKYSAEELLETYRSMLDELHLVE
jgi:glycosyltransferase involved in cell wall biosynthesis